MATTWIVQGDNAKQWLREHKAGDLAERFCAECIQIAGAWNDFEDGGLVWSFNDAHQEAVGQIKAWMKSHGHNLTEAEGIDLLEALRRDLMALVAAARAFAEQVHAGQERKAAPGVPYVVHLQDVAGRVQRVGSDDIVQAAAWLHDAPEDQGVQLAELGERFGVEVAAAVAAVTEIKYGLDGQKRPWLDRKKDLLLGFDGLDQATAHRAAQVLAADAAAACDDLAEGLATSNPADFWPLFNAPPTWIVAYQAARLEVVRRELGEQHPLAVELAGSYQRLLAAAGFAPEQVPSLFSLS